MTPSMPLDPTVPPTAFGAAGEALPELELSEEDIHAAMRHLSGYIDISTSDFQAIYHLAHTQAIERLFGGLRAGRLMRTGMAPLTPDQSLADAATALARQGLKGLPVVDAGGAVLGMLTETDCLRELEAAILPELLVRLIEASGQITHRCHETRVGAAMTAPAVSVDPSAGFAAMIAAFQRHPGRGMPVVDAEGKWLGLLLRKDFLAAFRLGEQL
ncbi:Inosine-5'-monophosphate dehydrogenase [Thiorhodovibrio winogradskyi]|uniref:Inosine-5'-monophosphate dehydrogenase n=1 Tax=Thiorhodovibrio winogradskyi TaxID=77007 RepID=A0ABZ0S8V7_9GAMM|nr:CBS domain-containing protein [Thiorhodovibrio winogradskyi]